MAGLVETGVVVWIGEEWSEKGVYLVVGQLFESGVVAAGLINWMWCVVFLFVL